MTSSRQAIKCSQAPQLTCCCHVRSTSNLSHPAAVAIRAQRTYSGKYSIKAVVWSWHSIHGRRKRGQSGGLSAPIFWNLMFCYYVLVEKGFLF